jgi:phosphoglycolate phosphatase
MIFYFSIQKLNKKRRLNCFGETLLFSALSSIDLLMSSLKYKGIIFDLDNTLIDSNLNFPKMKTKIIKLLEKNGFPKGILSSTEMTTVEIMELAEIDWKKKELSNKTQETLRKKIEQYMNEGELESVDSLKEIQGSKKAVNELKSQGFKLAILTRGHHEYAIAALKKIGMFKCFDLVLGRGETPKPKPYKEALEHTIKLLKLKINEVIFIGDNQIDYDCAQNTGCTFIGVATGRRGIKSWKNEQPPKILLKSVAELPRYLDTL